MTIENTSGVPRHRLLEEAEERLRAELVAAQTAYYSAGPEERPKARCKLLAVLARFTNLVLYDKLPEEQQRSCGSAA